MLNIKFKKHFSILAILFSAFVLFAEIGIKNSAKNNVAKVGETVSFKISDCPDNADYTMIVNGLHADKGKVKDILKVSPKACGGVILVLNNAVEKDSPAEKKFLNRNGVLVSPEQIKVANEEPSDLNSFWNKAKKDVDALKPNFVLKKLGIEDSVEVYEFEIPLGEGEYGTSAAIKAVGYMAKPVGSKKCPAILTVYGAGSYTASKYDAIKYAKLGAIGLSLNPHPIPNSTSKEEIEKIKSEKLKVYRLTGKDSEDINDVYFLGMFKRLYAVLSAVENMKEFNGKNFVVRGFSQGGAQSIMASYLSKKVTAIAALCPAMCDLGSINVGRRSSWPFWVNSKKDEVQNQNSKYFDMALLAKYAKANMFLAIGLLDETCSPSSVMAMHNNYGGKKEYMLMQNVSHGWNEEFTQRENDFVLKQAGLKK